MVAGMIFCTPAEAEALPCEGASALVSGPCSNHPCLCSQLEGTAPELSLVCHWGLWLQALSVYMKYRKRPWPLFHHNEHNNNESDNDDDDDEHSHDNNNNNSNNNNDNNDN